MSETIVVIGNGPSLRGFDFRQLEGVHTLGMNAAYRHWDRIGWYPTYYCCLDDQLIQTHHKEIYRLVKSGQVEAAFVHGSFFDLHPDAAADDRFWSADQFHPHWYKLRGKLTGKPYLDSAAFKTSDQSKVTTGAYAVRFCAHLGYKRIGLIGVDLKYVEKIAEADQAGGIKLVIKETPAHNPNYFFDDYQQKGDKFNFPNPEVHGGRLHIESFRVLRDDYFNFGINASITNCNLDSALEAEAIFPFTDLPRFIGRSLLGAVVVPCTQADIPQILTNFQLWVQPAFAPFLTADGMDRPVLALVFNRVDSAQKRKFELNYKQLDLGRFFSELQVHSLDLTGAQDTYMRRYDRPSGPEGYKAGPNNQFLMTMRLARTIGPYVFLMEADCIPIRPNWLGRLISIVNGSEPFFVLGSAYRGIGNISPTFGRHINGNAVYAAGDPEFIEFLENIWEKELRRVVEHEDRRLAYDCVLELYFNGAFGNPKDSLAWHTWQRTAHKLRYTGYIQNISAADDMHSVEAKLVHRLLGTSPETFMVHSQAVARGVANLLSSGARPLPVEISTSADNIQNVKHPDFLGFHFVNNAASSGVLREGDDYMLPPGSADQYITCKYAGLIRAGDKIGCSVTFSLQQRAKLSIMLCRDGVGKFESSRKVETFKPGNHTVTVEHVFRNAFSGARVQIGAETDMVKFQLLSSKMEKMGSALKEKKAGLLSKFF